MGTSLSGLTPATTFDGLLKVGDNDPLTADLKAISTGDGTDTILSLSNTALQVNGDLNIGSVHQAYQDLNDLIIKGNSGSTYLKYYTNSGNNLTNQFGVGNFLKYATAIGESVLPNTNAPMLRIKGSGADVNTTSLLVENSAGSDAFEVKDNLASYAYGGLYSSITRVNYINTFNNAYSVMQTHQADGNASFHQSVAVGQTTTPAARLHVKGSGNDDTTTSLLVQNSDGDDILTIKDDRSFKISSDAGTVFNIDSNGSQAIGTSSRATLFNGSSTSFLRDVGIGETTPTARLHVKAAATQDTIARFQDPLQTWSYIDIKNDSVLTDYTGIFWGSRAKIRSKEVGPVFIDCTGGVSFLDGNSTKSNINSQGAIAIGASAAPASTMAYIKGSGNSNTTTALLVQNSDGNDLLKVNDAGATTIVSDNTGTDYPFQINTSSSGLFKIQNLNSATTPVLGISHGSQDTRLSMYTTMGFRVQGVGIADMTSSEVRVGGGSGARLAVKGSGNGNTTAALLVENSAGAERFKVRDDGLIFFGQPNSYMIGGNGFGGTWFFAGDNIFRGVLKNDSGSVKVNDDLNVGGNADNDTGVRLQVKGAGNDATTTALLVQNSDGVDMLKVTDDGATTIQSNFGVNGGDVIVFQNNADPTNQFKINKRDDSTNIWHTGTTNTEIQYRDNIHFRFNIGGVTQMQLRNTGNLGLGVGSSNASARMHIKGSGATSATTALLVQNSAGTDLLKVTDDGSINIQSYKQLSASSSNYGIVLESTTSMQFKSWAKDFRFFTQNGVVAEIKNDGSTIIGGSTPDTSAKLQVDSTTQGFLPPRMTDAERDAITTPAPGLMVYDTSNNQMNYWNGTAWIAF